MLESSFIQLNVFHTNCILSPFRELNDGVSRIVPAQEKFESEMRYFSRNAWKNPTDVFSCLHYLQRCRLRYYGISKPGLLCLGAVRGQDALRMLKVGSYRDVT